MNSKLSNTEGHRQIEETPTPDYIYDNYIETHRRSVTIQARWAA